MRVQTITISLVALLVITSMSVAHVSIAYIASSTNYLLERDSINFGGLLSSSTSYSLEDTLGEVGTGYSSSTNYLVSAGYQQAVYHIAISSPVDVTLLPAMNTLQGGIANGSAVWTVTTDNPGGYSLSIKADASPALRSGSNSFANYTGAPDFIWSVSSSASAFGFTPEGADIATAYLDNGLACGVGALDTTLSCWDGVTTVDKTVATRAGANSPSGVGTTVRFRAEAGPSASQPAGSYSTLVTLTATAL